MQHVLLHARHEQALQGGAVHTLRLELGVIFGPKWLFALVDEVHEVSLAVGGVGVWVDQLECLRLLLDLANLSLLLTEVLFLGLRDFLLVALDPHALQQFELPISRPQLRVDALPHLLQVSDDPYSLFFLATLVLHLRELDVVVRDGDVAGVVVEVERAQVAGGRVDDTFALA
jgi:hypothetical protein